MFQQCYLRFCSEEYSLPKQKEKVFARFCPVNSTNDQEYENSTQQNYIYAHLTNHQVQKKSPTFNHSEEMPEDQMTCARFKQFLNDSYSDKSRNVDVWSERIEPTLERIIIESLKVWPKQGHRKNSFEVLGFDILLDKNLKPHLLEINTNPGMHMLTKVVRPHHFKLQQDLFKVILDKRILWEKVENPKNLTIGDWKLIYKEQK
jgi:hypothetical protein